MNKKIAVVISSFSGYLKEEIDKYDNIFITPLQLFIDSEQWFEGFYSKNESYEIVEKFRKSDDFKTSLAPLTIIEEQMKELSNNYDCIIYLPINSSISSSYNSILNVSKNFKNIYVFDNKFNGETFLIVAKEIISRYKNDHTIDEILEFLKWYNDRIIGYIIPYELKTFVKSGRLKGIKKTILSSLKIKTIIEVDKNIKNIALARTTKTAANKVILKINEFIQKLKMETKDFLFQTIYTFDKEIKSIFEEMVEKFFKRKIDIVKEASLATLLHTGWGAAYLGVIPDKKVYPKKNNK